MSQPSLSFTPEEEALIQQEYQALLSDYIASPHRKKTEIIDQAFRLACHAHGLVVSLTSCIQALWHALSARR